jgi:hypothetical protein
MILTGRDQRSQERNGSRCHFVHHIPHWTDLETNPSHSSEKPVSNVFLFLRAIQFNSDFLSDSDGSSNYLYSSAILSKRQAFATVIKSSWATSHVKWLGEEKANVSRTISVLIFRLLMCLEKQSAPGIGLPEFRTHVDALANGSC